MSGLIAARKLINTDYDVLLVEQDGFLGGVLKNSNKVKYIGNKLAIDWINETEKLITKSKKYKNSKKYTCYNL